MFHRTRTAKAANSDAAATFDQVLAELDAARHSASGAADGSTPHSDSAVPEAPADPAGSADPADPAGAADAAGEPASPGEEAAADPRVTEHTDALRATRHAQEQAQEMLALAAQAQTEAVEQAEHLVREAREAAARIRAEAEEERQATRHETDEWVATQRARVAAAVDEFTDAATREADEIRAEAMRNALAEAEVAARRRLGEAASQGSRDAEAIRALTVNVEAALHDIRERFTEIDTLLLDAQRSERRPAGAGPADDQAPLRRPLRTLLPDAGDDTDTDTDDAADRDGTDGTGSAG